MPLTPGTRLGSYEVTALIGEGDMGVVYLAHDLQLAPGRDSGCGGRGVCLLAVTLALAVGSVIHLNAHNQTDDPEPLRTTTAGGAGLALEPGAPSPPVAPDTISRNADGGATIRAVRIQGLVVDGNLDEAAYETVVPFGGFIQTEPTAGAPATEPTDVWVFFDDTNLYVAARAWDAAPESEWVVNEMRRDSLNILHNENIGFLIDTFYDRRNGIIFGINPIGGRMDAQVSNEGSYHADWNPVWTLATGRFEGGWSFEAAIPFKSMRYRPGRSQVWGFQMRRIVRHKNELSHLTRLDPALWLNGILQVSQSATLVGLEVPASGRPIEIKPYLIGDVSSNMHASPAVSNQFDGNVGLDLIKYGITENLTADFTVNTDFAQVEADEQQVNLTRFSLFFPEKREFFLENQGIFVFSRAGRPGPGAASADTPILFHSRQIGLNDGAEVPIMAGGRLTGRLGKVSLGLITIPDRRRAGKWRDDDELLGRAHQARFCSAGAASARSSPTVPPSQTAPGRTRPTVSTRPSRSMRTWRSTPTGRRRKRPGPAVRTPATEVSSGTTATGTA